jgi:creatinine amidohydrolase
MAQVSFMLENYSWKSARKTFRSKKVALVPVGSMEQHGPHLPLGTDFFIAQALAESAARDTGAICTPGIPIGVSAHHRQFWGTLWVSPQTFRQYVCEAAIGLGYHGVRRIIFVNGHGGNLPSLQEISRNLRPEKLYSVAYQWWTDPSVIELLNRLFKSKGTHAGAMETAMMLAIRPELVDAASYEEAARGAAAEFGIKKFGAELPVDTVEFSESGATLDPREATVEAGKRIFQTALDSLKSFIDWLENAKVDDLEPQAHRD